MAGKFSEKQYQPERQKSPAPVDWNCQNDLDYTNPYPCGVCGRSFTSRYALAHHLHRKKASQ